MQRSTLSRWRTLGRIVVLLIVLGLHLLLRGRAARGQAGLWYVAPGGNDAASCAAPDAPCATIKVALDRAAAGDTIYVAQGVYRGACWEQGCRVLAIPKDIHLSGGWDATFSTQNGMSILDGEHWRRVFGVAYGARVVVDRFVMRNGFADSAAGVANSGSTLTLNYCTIRDNGRPLTPGQGNGLFATDPGTTTLNHCIVINNVAESGAGIAANFGATVVLNDSAVLSNAASGEGAAIRTGGGKVVVNNSTIADNRSGANGVVEVAGGTLELHNATVRGNTSQDAGGAGIEVWESATARARNSIIAENRAGGVPADCRGAITSLGYNLIGTTANCAVSPGPGDKLNVDARLIPVARALGLVLLRGDSPAMDAGDPAGCADHTGAPLAADQRGAARVGRCDIGAYEYTPSQEAPASLVPLDDGANQETDVFRAFPAPLGVAALDSAYSQVVVPLQVTFSAPGSGASVTFLPSGSTTTAATDGDGVARVEAVANGLSGPYAVIVAAPYYGLSTTIKLANRSWQPAGGFAAVAYPLGQDPRNNNRQIRLVAPPDDPSGLEALATYDGSAPRNQMLRTRDGGRTWTTIRLPREGVATEAAIAPGFAANRTFYVLIDRYLYKTVDAGAHWQALPAPGQEMISLLRLSPHYQADHTIFVGVGDMWNGLGGIYRSSDDGQSWTRLSTTTAGDKVIDLDIAPAYPGDPTMFLSSFYGGIKRSDDAGRTWMQLPHPEDASGFLVTLTPTYAQDHTVFAAAGGRNPGAVHRSTDRGELWRPVLTGLFYPHAVAVSPRYADDHTAIAGGRTGPLYLTEDGGDSWQPLGGMICDPIYEGRCSAVLTYQDGMLIPLVSTYRALYRYRWPTMSGIAPVTVMVSPGAGAPGTARVAVAPAEADGAVWEALSGVPWIAVHPAGGRFPASMTVVVNPATLPPGTTETGITLVARWSRYQAQSYWVPVHLKAARGWVWLPMVMRR